MQVVTSNYLNGNQITVSDGTGTVYMGVDTANTLIINTPPHEEPSGNQDFYRGLCHYYQALDKYKAWLIKEETYPEGSVVDYKKLYEKLKQNF